MLLGSAHLCEYPAPPLYKGNNLFKSNDVFVYVTPKFQRQNFCVVFNYCIFSLICVIFVIKYELKAFSLSLKSLNKIHLRNLGDINQLNKNISTQYAKSLKTDLMFSSFERLCFKVKIH